MIGLTAEHAGAGSPTEIVNGGTLNFLALSVSSMIEGWNFLGPGS